jgi:hypothetical protein
LERYTDKKTYQEGEENNQPILRPEMQYDSFCIFYVK